MPMYEYKCSSCGKVFELIQKFSDAPLQSHGECGGAVERLVSAAALQFKGSGWYITDYAKKSGNNGSSGKDSGAETKSDSKSDSKSDAKSNTESTPASSTVSSSKASADKK
jgi:putative FmdB family regulatory protein